LHRRINETGNGFNGIYVSRFGNTPSAAEASTNLYDFVDIGSWVFDLNERAGS